MFDLSWTELLIIAVAAIIFIGPKDLPAALRALGKWTAKARGLARDFQSNLDEMVREAELDDVRKQVTGLASTDLNREIEKTIDPKGEIASALAPPDFSVHASGSSAAPPPPTPAPALPEPAASPSPAGGSADPVSRP